MAICSAALATSFSVSSVSLPGSGSRQQQQLKAREIGLSGGKSPSQKNSRRRNSPRNFSVRSDYSSVDNRGGGGADFLAGFLVGGAVFGTLAYVFAPQIRRSLLNEDEYGFRKARRPIYYDEGLEKTRQTLNAKISQLNSAIDNVSSRLRGGNNVSAAPMKSDPEVEAAM